MLNNCLPTQIYDAKKANLPLRKADWQAHYSIYTSKAGDFNAATVDDYNRKIFPASIHGGGDETERHLWQRHGYCIYTAFLTLAANRRGLSN
jgi:hypothetical protein